MIEDLRQYLKIDKHALDDELVKHPSLFFKVAEAMTEAVAERDLLKEELAYTDAELDKQVRIILGDKATEAKVKGQVAIHKDHVYATSRYLEAKKQADMLAALKEAFHNRGYMLRDLAQLYVNNYYSTDSVRTTPTTSDAVYEGTRAKMAERRRR